MSFVITDEGLERQRQTIEAAKIFFANAADIAEIAAGIEWYHVLVAVVGPDLNYCGATPILLLRLSEQIDELAQGGWTLVIKPYTTALQIEEQALSLGRTASKAVALMEKVRSRVGNNQPE